MEDEKHPDQRRRLFGKSGFIWFLYGFYMFFIEDLGVSAMILDGVLSTLIWRGTIQSQI